MNNDLTETARSLLALHDGACSVLRDSPIGEAFAEMERAGEVEIGDSDTQGFVNVRRNEIQTRKGLIRSAIARGNIGELLSIVHFPACACVGCQNGEPLCPCKMSAKEVSEAVSVFALIKGRTIRIKP